MSDNIQLYFNSNGHPVTINVTPDTADSIRKHWGELKGVSEISQTDYEAMMREREEKREGLIWRSRKES